MDLNTFIALVAVLAIVYACIVKYIQNKLIDRKEMQDIQAESKRLSDEFDKAKKADNKKKMDEIMKKQMEFLPRMNSMMFKQFKPMIFILGLFFIFTWFVGYVDPTAQNHIFMNMTDNGKGCDLASGDSNFTACYQINSTNYGKWVFTAHVYNAGTEVGSNATYFLYNSNISDNYTNPPKGVPVIVSTNKLYYNSGDNITIYAKTTDPTYTVVGELDNGTSFKVDLPFTIPIVNVQRIQQPYWWFFLISLITNLSVTVAMGQVDRMNKAKQKKEEEE